VENKNQKPRDTLFQVVESIKIIAKLKLKKERKKEVTIRAEASSVDLPSY